MPHYRYRRCHHRRSLVLWPQPVLLLLLLLLLLLALALALHVRAEPCPRWTSLPAAWFVLTVVGATKVEQRQRQGQRRQLRAVREVEAHLVEEDMQVEDQEQVEQEHQTQLQEQQQHMLEVVAVPFIFQELVVVAELVVEDVVLFIKVAHLNQIQIQQEMQTLVVEQVEVP